MEYALSRGHFVFNSRPMRFYFQPLVSDSFHYFHDLNNGINKKMIRQK